MNHIYRGSGTDRQDLIKGDIIQHVHSLIFQVIEAKCDSNMLRCNELDPKTMRAKDQVSWVPAKACWLLMRLGHDGLGSPEFIEQHGRRLKATGKRYGWSFDTDLPYSAAEDSIEAALAEARLTDEGSDEPQHSSVYICEAVDYKPSIDAEYIIEQLEEHAFETVGEVMTGWMTGASVEQKAELEKLITAWSIKHFPIHFYLGVNPKEYDLATGQVVEEEPAAQAQ